MKRSSRAKSSMIALVALIGVMGLGLSQNAVAANLHIRFAWYMPPHTAVSVQANEIASRIESMSHGSIKVDTYPSGSLLKESNIGQGLSNNTANMIISAMHWWSGKDPALQWDTIPFLADNASSLLKKLHGPLGSDVNKQLNQFGAEVIGWSFYGYAKSYINSKHPVKKPSDLKGLKLRSEGKLAAQFLKSQGATPVAMDSSEVYTAMQRGTLDGGMSGLSTFISRKWYEVGKYITAIHYVPLVYPIQVNRQWWMGLKPSQRKVIKQAVASTEGDAVALIEKGFKNGITTAREYGDKVYVPSKANLALWKQATEARAKKSYLKDSGSKGRQILKDVSGSIGS